MTEDDKRSGPRDPEKSRESKSPKESAIRPAQVAAAALAAITAAFLGSTLGVYGTVLGAGLISVVTTVGSELYVRSLDRTKAAARSLPRTRIRRAARPSAGGHGSGSPHTAPDQVTVRLPRPGHRFGAEPIRALPPVPGAYAAFGDQDAAARRVRWKRRMPVLVATSVAAFVVGMVAVTGYESVSGRALSGQGGTTVGTIVGKPGAGVDVPDRNPDGEDPRETGRTASSGTGEAEPGGPTGETVPSVPTAPSGSSAPTAPSGSAVPSGPRPAPGGESDAPQETGELERPASSSENRAPRPDGEAELPQGEAPDQGSE